MMLFILDIWNLMDNKRPQLYDILTSIDYTGEMYDLTNIGTIKINRTNKEPKYEILDDAGNIKDDSKITQSDVILESYLASIKGPNDKYNLFSYFYKFESEGYSMQRYPGKGGRNSVLEQIAEIFSQKFIKYRDNSYTSFSMLTERSALIAGILIGRFYRFGLLADDKMSPILPFSLLPLYMENLFFGVGEEFEKRHIQKIIKPTTNDIILKFNQSLNFIKKHFVEKSIEITHQTKEEEIRKYLEDYQNHV